MTLNPMPRGKSNQEFMAAGLRQQHNLISSWPGPDPAIHVYRLPQGVDARIKSGHDGFETVMTILTWP